jgi:hypothetical protein
MTRRRCGGIAKPVSDEAPAHGVPLGPHRVVGTVLVDDRPQDRMQELLLLFG